MTHSLESLRVQELNAQEIREIEGGIAPLVVYGAYLLAGIAVGLIIGYYLRS